MSKHKTREQWLVAALTHLKRIVEPHLKGEQKVDIKKYRVSVGWPSGGGDKIGQCWDPVASDGGVHEMFISPEIAEPLRVLDILLHELVHAVVGIKEGHRGEFKRVARAVGLEGKLTATVVTPDSPLHKQLAIISSKLGEYPHQKLKRLRKGRRPWEKRLMFHSPTLGIEYRAFMILSQVKRHGPPRDPLGDKMVPYKPGAENKG
jgi:hypothetical protein